MAKIFNVTKKHVVDMDTNTILDAWVDGLFMPEQCDEEALRLALDKMCSAYTNTFKDQVSDLNKELDDVRYSNLELEAEIAEQNGIIQGLRLAIKEISKA